MPFVQIWEVFSDYFSEYFFTSTFLLSFLDSDEMNVRYFVVPWDPKALLKVFQSIFIIQTE